MDNTSLLGKDIVRRIGKLNVSGLLNDDLIEILKAVHVKLNAAGLTYSGQYLEDTIQALGTELVTESNFMRSLEEADEDEDYSSIY